MSLGLLLCVCCLMKWTLLTIVIALGRFGNLPCAAMQDLLTKKLFFGWLVLASVVAFAVFGIDKWRAKRTGGRRISQFNLLIICALGGWIGGLLGMVIFRHKSAKRSFQLQFFLSLIIFVLLFAGAMKFTGNG